MCLGTARMKLAGAASCTGIERGGCFLYHSFALWGGWAFFCLGRRNDDDNRSVVSKLQRNSCGDRRNESILVELYIAVNRHYIHIDRA